MIINTNVAALNTFNALNKNTSAMNQALSELSTGKKINSAADDPSGLTISEQMQGQTNGLNQANSNTQNGISLIQTAEGGLTQTSSILQTMRELAVQASNGTNTTEDTQAMQDQINQYTAQIDNIANTTQFNTISLLNGTIGNDANLSGTNGLNLQPVKVADAGLAADTYTVTNTAAATLGATVKTNTTGLAANTDFTLTSGKVTGLELGDYTLNVANTATAGTYDMTLQDANGTTVASDNAFVATAGGTLTGTNEQGTATKFTIGIDGSMQAGSMTFNLNATYATAGDFNIKNTAGATTYASAANLKITNSNFQAGGLQFDMTTDTALAAADKTSTITTTNNALSMQIGANQNQTMSIAVGNMGSGVNGLNIGNLNLTTTAGAEAAISTIDNAISTVSAQNSTLGAYQDRLQYTSDNLTAASQNLTSANSTLVNVDMASEMSQYTQDSILVQAATSMLAQANQEPQTVLKLLQ